MEYILSKHYLFCALSNIKPTYEVYIKNISNFEKCLYKFQLSNQITTMYLYSGRCTLRPPKKGFGLFFGENTSWEVKLNYTQRGFVFILDNKKRDTLGIKKNIWKMII